MPIHLAQKLRRLTRQQFTPLSYEIRGCAFRMHQRFGRLGDELVCQRYLAQELALHQFEVVREFAILVEYGSFQKRYCVDLVINQCGVVEAKAVAGLTQEHEMQLMNYLLLLDVERGLLLNFRTQSVQSRFVNAPARLEFRRDFQVERAHWTSSSSCMNRYSVSRVNGGQDYHCRFTLKP